MLVGLCLTVYSSIFKTDTEKEIPFLYTGITFANLKLSGTIPVSKEVSLNLDITVFKILRKIVACESIRFFRLRFLVSIKLL